MRSYEGKHWMQNPANKEKMMATVRKMKRGKAQKKSIIKRMSAARKANMQYVANHIAKVARGHGKKEKTSQAKDTSLVVNGWRIILGKDEIRIDHE